MAFASSLKLPKAALASDEALFKQIPEEYRSEARLLLNELNKRNPTQQEKQNLVHLVQLIISEIADYKKELPETMRTFFLLKEIINHKNYIPEILENAISSLRKNGTIFAFKILGRCYDLLENLKYSPELNREILKTAEYVTKISTNDALTMNNFIDFLHCHQELVNARTLDTIKLVVEKLGDYAYFALSKMQDKRFNHLMLDIMDRIVKSVEFSLKYKSRSRDDLDIFEKKIIPELNLMLGIASQTKLDLEKTASFIKRLSIKNIDDIETLLNFGWALATIGEEKTRALYYDFGIEYFYRYTKKTLEELYKSRNAHYKEDRSVVLAVFNKNDHNGAFYREGEELEKLTKFYKVIIIETDIEDGFYKAIEKTGKIEGGIDVLIVGGHGSPDRLILGNEKGLSEAAYLDLTDEQEIKERALKKWMRPSSKAILIGCSTGKDEKSIAAMNSRTLGIEETYAPRDKSSKTNYHLKKSGELENVTYDVEAGLFRQGWFFGPTMDIIPKRSE